MAESPARRRRTPITRSEGERRLIAATLDLCRQHPFGEVTVREIARHADVNHGFVHTWFGSKADLVLAATRVLTDELTPRIAAGEFQTVGMRSPDVVLLIRLLAWLQTEPHAADQFTGRRPVIDTATRVFELVYGFDTPTAITLAEITTAAVAGTALVGDVLHLDDDAMMSTWLSMLALYAAMRTP